MRHLLATAAAVALLGGTAYAETPPATNIGQAPSVLAQAQSQGSQGQGTQGQGTQGQTNQGQGANRNQDRNQLGDSPGSLQPSGRQGEVNTNQPNPSGPTGQTPGTPGTDPMGSGAQRPNEDRQQLGDSPGSMQPTTQGQPSPERSDRTPGGSPMGQGNQQPNEDRQQMGDSPGSMQPTPGQSNQSQSNQNQSNRSNAAGAAGAAGAVGAAGGSKMMQPEKMGAQSSGGQGQALQTVTIGGDQFMTPGAGTYSARALIGTEIYGPTSEVIARVDDVVIAEDGAVKSFIVDRGGFLGFGEQEVAIKSGELSFGRDANGNVFGISGVTEQELEQIAENRYDANARYEPATEADFTLMQDVLGKSVVGSGGEQIASVRDVLLSRDGKISHLILANGGILGLGGELTAVEMSTLSFEEGDTEEGAIVADMSKDELANKPAFRYDAE